MHTATLHPHLRLHLVYIAQPLTQNLWFYSALLICMRRTYHPRVPPQTNSSPYSGIIQLRKTIKRHTPRLLIFEIRKPNAQLADFATSLPLHYNNNKPKYIYCLTVSKLKSPLLKIRLVRRPQPCLKWTRFDLSTFTVILFT